ncbi:hypothetical protein KFZ56_15810 [Virgibacillus sp. NKC19-3]|nr:hypothetical protein [Virgibacillus sp. NKC19-3]MBY7144490.1 hypothetical protein [Virgibacillus sp. NKC19-3]
MSGIKEWNVSYHKNLLSVTPANYACAYVEMPIIPEQLRLIGKPTRQ